MVATLRSLFLLAVLLIGIYLFRAPLTTVAAQLSVRYLPCVQPIDYTVGTFDTRFDISEEDFIDALTEAETMWEEASGLDLFEYSASAAPLRVNLVYDNRQATTEKLQELDGVVDETRTAYEALKDQYLAARTVYFSAKSRFEATYAKYRIDEAAYNRDVRYWNDRGGAPAEEYARLQDQKVTLAARLAGIQEIQREVNAAAQSVNTFVDELNTEARALNLNIAQYNRVGEQAGGEFEEAVFESAPGALTIDVYEFGDRAKLVRVLAHELGHALGLEHVEDERAIMYRVNQSTNAIPTEADLAEIDRVCGAK